MPRMRKLDRDQVAKNHQYLGVNNAVQATRDIRANQGRLGVFWHTQGSGKSYSISMQVPPDDSTRHRALDIKNMLCYTLD